MKSYNNVRNDDMKLLYHFFGDVTEKNLPISIGMDSVSYNGIPQGFTTKMKREILDANIIKTIFTAKNPSGIELTVECKDYKDFPVREWVAYITNNADTPSPIISDFKIFNAVIPGKAPVLTYGNGDTHEADGYEVYKEAVDTAFNIFPTDGTGSCGASPFMRLQYEDKGINIAIGWPAMWDVCINPEGDGVRFVLGQKRCNMKILPGETIRTPRVFFMAYEGGEDRGRNLWRKFYFAHVLPRPNGNPLTPKLVLHTFEIGGHPEFTGATEENQIIGIDEYLKSDMHPDVWWLDAGWYDCNFNWPDVGTWDPNPKHFPNGLGPVGKKCEENNIDFLLWCEPERVIKGREIWEDHPEWLLYTDSPDCALLNLGNKDACDWIINKIDNLIKESHVKVYRQDFNYAPLPAWQMNEAEDRIGALENLHVQGYLRYWDELLMRNPGLWIDTCASGGRRNEMETLMRSVPLHYTDVGYGHHPIKQKQYRMMHEWVPFFRSHTNSWDNPETGEYDFSRRAVDEFAYHTSLAPCISCTVEYYDPEEIKDVARMFHPIWRRAAQMMLESDYYPLTECRKSSEDYYAVQFDNPDKREGFIHVIRNVKAEGESFTTPYLCVNGASYELYNPVTGEELTLTGEELEKGFTVSIPKRAGSLWFYKY